MVRHADESMERAPRLAPQQTLRSWLEASQGRIVRVPLSVRLGPPRREEVSIELEDSAPGSSFDDQVRFLCRGARRCRVRVEGRWALGTLTVLNVSRSVEPDEAADHVEREAR